MGTFQRPNRLFFLAIIGLSTILAACSSGGGSSGKAANDTRPDPFTLIAPSDIDLDEVAFDTPIVSDPVTIKGIDTAAPVSIEGGEYAIGDGEFTNAPGTVRNGQNVRVRVQSPVKAEQSATATLNIGGVTESFTVTTGPDTVPPEVSILFPPPASMTEGATLFLRGTVKDANGTLGDGAVTVNGVEAELALNEAGDEGTWSVEVALAPGDNTVPVVAWDAAGNSNDVDESSISQVSVRRVESIEGESFPDNSVPFSEPISLDIHFFDETPVALVTDPSAQAIIAIDLLTGKRSVFSDNETQEDSLLEYPWSIHVGENGQTYVFDWYVEQPRIYELDDSGTRKLLIEKDETENSIDTPFGLYLMGASNSARLYLADRGRLLGVDVQTKDKVVISDSLNGIPNFENPIAASVGLVFDEKSERFIVISVETQRLHSIDVKTGQRSRISIEENLIISDGTILRDGKFFLAVEVTKNQISMIDLDSGRVTMISGPGLDATNLFHEPRGVAVSHNGGYALVADRVLKSVVALDLVSRQQVIVSKSQ